MRKRNLFFVLVLSVLLALPLVSSPPKASADGGELTAVVADALVAGGEESSPPDGVFAEYGQNPASTDLLAVTPSSSVPLQAQGSPQYTIATSFQEGIVLKSPRKSFSVALYRDGVHTMAHAVLVRVGASSSRAIENVYSDAAKDSFVLDMADSPSGDYVIRVTSERYPGEGFTKDYRFTYKKIPKGGALGYVTMSVEAFTIGLGYLEEPMRLPLFMSRMP